MEKVKVNKSVERYFFEYAFPCMGVLVNIGKISKSEYKELEEMFVEGRVPDRERLEWIFSSAFRRLRILASDMGKDVWDINVMKKYWIGKNHNDFIDAGEGAYGTCGESFKDYCKVNMARVIQRNGKKLLVEYGGRKAYVMGTLLPDVIAGDLITVHHSHAVEKIS